MSDEFDPITGTDSNQSPWSSPLDVSVVESDKRP